MGQGNVLTCVILFTKGGGGGLDGGWLPSISHRSHDQHPVEGVSFPASITSHMAKGRGVCIQGVGFPACITSYMIRERGSASIGEWSPPRENWERGRYASYWNAFLFILYFTLYKKNCYI